MTQSPRARVDDEVRHRQPQRRTDGEAERLRDDSTALNQLCVTGIDGPNEDEPADHREQEEGCGSAVSKCRRMGARPGVDGHDAHEGDVLQAVSRRVAEERDIHVGREIGGGKEEQQREEEHRLDGIAMTKVASVQRDSEGRDDHETDAAQLIEANQGCVKVRRRDAGPENPERGQNSTDGAQLDRDPLGLGGRLHVLRDRHERVQADVLSPVVKRLPCPEPEVDVRVDRRTCEGPQESRAEREQDREIDIPRGLAADDLEELPIRVQEERGRDVGGPDEQEEASGSVEREAGVDEMTDGGEQRNRYPRAQQESQDERALTSLVGQPQRDAAVEGRDSARRDALATAHTTCGQYASPERDVKDERNAGLNDILTGTPAAWQGR